jgi:hypothetical protein
LKIGKSENSSSNEDSGQRMLASTFQSNCVGGFLNMRVLTAWTPTRRGETLSIPKHVSAHKALGWVDDELPPMTGDRAGHMSKMLVDLFFSDSQYFG